MDEPGAVTQDSFLGGRLTVLQPVRGYRAGIDAVLLAAAVPARPGEAVLELGCGVGVVSLCLATRVAGLAVHGVEVQPHYAALARRNAMAAGLDVTIWQADLRRLPDPLRARSFEHVVANPPFFRRSDGPAAADPGRETAMGEAAALAAWLDTAVRRLAPGGVLSVIHRAERLPDLLAGLDGRVGAVQVLPLAGRAGQPAGRVILRAVKGRRSPFRLLAPLVLHDGPAHRSDAEDYTRAVSDVFRNVAALPGFSENSAN